MKKFILIACFVLLNTFLSSAQVEKNIELLRSAQYRLEANPNDEQALSFILRLLRDENGINRSNAAAVLGYAGEKVGASLKDKALPPLIALLDKGDGADKQVAAESIRRFGAHSAEAIPVLRKYLSPSSEYLAGMCADALGKIGEPAAAAVPELLKLLEDNAADSPGHRSRSRESAARALGEIGPKSIAAAPTLFSLINRTNDLEFKAILAVAVIRVEPSNSKAVTEIEKLMRSGNVDVRVATLMELTDAGVNSRPAMRVIKAAAQNDRDPEIRGMARRLLNLLNGKN